MRIKLQLLSLIGIMAIISCQNKKELWEPLFNGKDLTGWEVKNGNAPYTIGDSTIIGTSVLNSPNTFLCTTREYSDFILELDVKVDSNLNSGIQIRSLSIPEYMDGRVHGYQVEIDPSPRAFSGGIYDEARRGWLQTLADNPKAREAFRKNDWNHYRIQAIGDTIITWINGVPAAWVLDTLTRKGFIALQVHSIGQDTSKQGTKVMWKNIWIRTEQLDSVAFKGNPGIPQANRIPNAVSAWEEKQGWKLLFNSTDTSGWRGVYKEKFPEKGWTIEKGVLTVLASDGGESTHGGDIVTVDEYANFELLLEFKITPGANSGIKYFVTEAEHNTGSAIGLEYQILDDKLHPDALKGSHEGSRTLGSLYDLIKAENKRVNGIGEWNLARILVYGNHVEHWLNGFKILEFERGSKEFRKLVAESKYKVWKNFGEAERGHILLQDHGNEVSFRSIKIRTF